MLLLITYLALQLREQEKQRAGVRRGIFFFKVIIQANKITAILTCNQLIFKTAHLACVENIHEYSILGSEQQKFTCIKLKPFFGVCGRF